MRVLSTREGERVFAASEHGAVVEVSLDGTPARAASAPFEARCLCVFDGAAGATVLAGGHDGALCVWAWAAEPHLTATVEGAHGAAIACLALFAPPADAPRLLTAADDCTLSTWGLEYASA